MEVREIKVGIADLNAGSAPDKLITVGLGSCIGIALYDKVLGIGGLAHIMLPDSTLFNTVNNPIKFADLAIPMLLSRMEKLGATKKNLRAKIAGGASMFNFSDKSMIMDVGNRNSQAVKAVLEKLSIPILGEDVGGNKGRTMIFDTKTGIVQIRTVGLGIKEL
ncbi:chemotaxis protein CheD [Clostridium swellfunianum]|uniref:chemotaxis protein CheD n=1 Tax=Clostridium swellfunianum TaxID=1367462 RepID=UPI00202E9E0C|nr:chemotaxis protein CheD [Clostridium swellfunianum]MCM0650477.1 chemotaxis protein CheD [Clostridium swellfunianum]